MNYRTWRTYLADTMEHLGLTQAEAVANIDGILRARRFPEEWKYHAVRISDEAINYMRHSLTAFDAALRDSYAPALRNALNTPTAFAQALDNEMNAIEADIAGDLGRQIFGGTHGEHVKAHNEYKVKMEARRAYNAVWHRRTRKFLTKQRHPVEAIVRKRGWIKPYEHECDDY